MQTDFTPWKKKIVIFPKKTITKKWVWPIAYRREASVFYTEPVSLGSYRVYISRDKQYAHLFDILGET